ncbi:phospholipase D family protein [Oryzomonas rubra]|uniref:phospholipase D n=2 Tax=Oryzomonas rubra TaxID=2509454 RepID=A0A5A9X5X8_9BACT|nr:phospholipase D family protein [Oryzomonas rubra]
MFIAVSASAAPLPATGTVEAFFSPQGGVTEAVVNEIGKARTEILVQAYSFTSKPIAKAIVDARKRGVRIEAILDKSNATARYTAATFLVNVGIPVLIDAEHAIAHNKIMIIDRATLITGSFNFTKAAEEKNAENLLIIKGNKPLVEKYLYNYETHKTHATPYTR